MFLRVSFFGSLPQPFYLRVVFWLLERSIITDVRFDASFLLFDVAGARLNINHRTFVAVVICFHGMIGLPSTAATNGNFVCGVIMISSWSQNPGSSNYTGMIRYGITRFHFCPKPTLLRGVICWEEGVICRNWKTVHFQFRISRFSGMVRMTNHGRTRRTESNWAILFWFFDAGTMALPSFTPF